VPPPSHYPSPACVRAVRYNRLTTIVRSSLANLKKALKGLVVMDADLEALANSLMVQQRPALWMKRSYPSLKSLGGYIGDMLHRLQFFRDWIDNGMPESFWVSGFFFTQAFFTGTSQNYARKYGISIDLVEFDYHILATKPEETAAPEDGVHVFGLFLEGARYSAAKGSLDESEPKVLFTEVPMMWFQPMESDKIPEKPHYMCPLYKTSDRRGVLSTTGHSTNFVMYLKLPSDIEQAHWIKRGVAGLCALDD
jgi:dynein heavy chain